VFQEVCQHGITFLSHSLHRISERRRYHGLATLRDLAPLSGQRGLSTELRHLQPDLVDASDQHAQVVGDHLAEHFVWIAGGSG